MTESDIVREAEDCASRLRVLADPTRLAILELLLERPRTVGEINQVIDIKPALLSHHLRALREAELVDTIRNGRSIEYHLAPGVAAARRSGIDLGCCKLRFDGPAPWSEGGGT